MNTVAILVGNTLKDQSRIIRKADKAVADEEMHVIAQSQNLRIVRVMAIDFNDQAGQFDAYYDLTDSKHGVWSRIDEPIMNSPHVGSFTV